MKGVALVVVLIFTIGPVLCNPPIKEPTQYEQLCNNLNVTGTGIIDMSTSMVDKRIALEYFNALSGNGSLEMGYEKAFSESARKVNRDIGMENQSSLNVFDKSKITYSGESPLVGAKSLSSKSFYGGIGANVMESFSVKEMEGDLKSYFSSTSTATGTHLVGTDTKSTFNGTWTTDTSWHKLFDKNIKSHQSFSGKFELDRQIKLHEKAPYKSALKCTKTPSSVNVREGDTVTYEYRIENPSDTLISDINLVDGDLGRIDLDKTALGPDESASGTATYTITEDDILTGPRETVATVTGIDNLKERVESRCASWLIPVAEYYEGNSFTTAICPECNNCNLPRGDYVCARCEVAPESFNLYRGNITIYALDVNMTQSRYPFPSCPYIDWPTSNISTAIQFGATSENETKFSNPIGSVWQGLSLDPGNYVSEQAYSDSEGGIISGGLLNWNTPYAGIKPNGGFHCTGDPMYDSFDLKMVLTNLGIGAGFRADAYQRVYRSTEPDENAYEWRQIGSQEVPEMAIDKKALKPFILVANTGNSSGGGTISWSRIIAAN